jgi:hypothetical protein
MTELEGMRSTLAEIAVTFWVMVALHFFIIGASAANTIIVGTDTLYTTVVFAALSQVGLAFLAQFKAERGSDIPAV